MIPRLRAALPLAGIVVLAALRFWAIGFGLPYPHARPDEETAVRHAVAILHGDPNPHFFNWPSLTLYVFAAALAVARSAGRELSAVDTVVLARAVVAAAGTLTVIATAAIGAAPAQRPRRTRSAQLVGQRKPKCVGFVIFVTFAPERHLVASATGQSCRKAPRRCP